MTTKSVIKYSTILKRSQCMKLLTESTKPVDSQKLYENVSALLGKSKNGKEAGLHTALRSYISSLCNTENASQYYWQPLDIIESLNKLDTSVSDRIVSEYTSRVIPYVEELYNVTDSVSNNHENLTESQYNEIMEAVKMNIAADRIIKNHNNISKRFNMENEVKRYQSLGLKYFIDSCANLVDTYNIKNYQKFNITLEETAYVLEKNGIDYDKKDLLKYTLEYFLVSNPYVSDTEINNLRSAINESYILSESDTEKVDYLFNDKQPKSIESSINAYLIGMKYSDTLSSYIMSAIDSTTKEDIVYNIDKVIYFLWDLKKSETFEDDTCIYNIIQLIANFIINATDLTDERNEFEETFTKEDIATIITSISNCRKSIEEYGNINYNHMVYAVNFIDRGIDPCLTSLKDAFSIIYNEANIEAINYVNATTESIPLNEFKIFKFNNLVRAAFNLDKFLKVKEKKLYNAGKNKVKKFISKTKSILFGEMAEVKENLYAYIGDDNKADICIRQYQLDESEYDDAAEFLSSVCEEYNDLISSQNSTARAYYIINPGVAELHIKESTTIELTEEEYNEIHEYTDYDLELYSNMLEETTKVLSQFGNFNHETIDEQVLSFTNYDGFTMEHFESALEALSYLDIPKDTIKVFGEKFADYRFNESINNGSINESYNGLSKDEKKINSLTENWESLEDVDPSIQLEAYKLFIDIMESVTEAMMADDWDLDEDDDEDDEDEKEDKKETKSSSKPKSKSTGVNKKAGPDLKKPDISPNAKKENEEDKDDKAKDPYDKPGIKDDPNYKPSKSKISLTGIKLGLKGLATKFKDMNNKQREAARNLDTAVKSTVTAMQNSMKQERREQIIKGSVIPSFSKCIKSGIALTALGVATGGIVVPVIAAIGGYAINKKLDEKERLLILDEIDTELDVVEKELSIAESNNQINKYRTLLKYKKELQRTYQRVRYNIKVTKDVSVNTGILKKD